MHAQGQQQHQNRGGDSSSLFSRVLVESLETRELLSGTTDPDPLNTALGLIRSEAAVQAQPMHAGDRARSTTPTQKQLSSINKAIQNFEKQLLAEVKRNAKRQSNAKFQQHIAVEQAQFAKRIAKRGGSFTPIPFTNLVAGNLSAGTPGVSSAPGSTTGGSTGGSSTPSGSSSSPAGASSTPSDPGVTSSDGLPVAGTVTVAAAPTVTATVISSYEIDLSWTATTGASAYEVEYSYNGGTTWNVLATPTSNFFAHVNVTPDSVYQYRVSTVNAAGISAASTVVTAATPPLAPSGLSATTSSTPPQINLSWSAVTDATNYKIERSINNSTWTALSPSPALSGTSTAYSDATVTAGNLYYYRISALEGTASSAPSVAIQVGTFPTTPTLTATSISPTQINLSWTTSPSAYSYKLETSTDGGTTWSTLATQATTSYSNTGLTTDTSYQYRVSAINGTGASPASSVATIATLLTAPTGLAATIAGSTEIDLTWTAVTDATNYKIERSTDQTTWTTLTPNPALSGTSTAYNDTSAVAGTTYYYRISAIDAAGTSPASTAVHGQTYPAIPTLTATVFSATQVNLSWTASPTATSYKVETSTDSGTTWTTLSSPTTTTYSNTGLTADTSYQYRVSATNAGGTSSPSAVKTVTTLLASPAGLAATTASATEIDLTWTAETDATNYKIERSLNNSTWTALTPTPALSGTSTAYNDTSVVAGTTYYYRLSSIDAAGTSAPATAVNAQTLSATPTLTATVFSATQVNLSWTASLGATSYKLETSTDSGTTWTTLVSPTTTSYSNTGLTADTSYQYRVSAVNGAGTSPASAVKTVTTLLASPAGLAATVPSTTEVDLTWTAETDATSYKIERSLNNSTWTTLTPSPALSGTDTAYNDTALTAGTTYYYRISGIDASGTSAAATAIHTVTLPAATTLTATVFSATQVNLSWTAVVSATSYKVEQSTDSGTTWTTLASPTTTSYSNTGLTADTSYQYRVSAVNASGTGAASAVKTVSTLLVAPTGLTATTAGSTEIDLTWTAVTDATSYKIERSTNQTTWTALTPSPALSGTSTAYNDTSATAGTTFYYRISAIDAAGTSAASTSANSMTYPAVPTLTATVFSATQVNLSWTASTSATSYKVETSTDSGTTWTTLSSPTTTSYSNTGLTADTSYQYRVSATNAGGTSSPSAVKTVTTLLASPAGLAATTPSTTEIDLTWTAETDATSYKLERSLNNTTWTTLSPTPALTGTSTAYNDTALTAGTTYYYRISGIDAAGTSAPATAVHLVTLPAITTLTATVFSATQVNLTWTAVTSATSYTVEQSTDSGTTWTTLSSPTTTSYSNTGLTADTGYQYRVTAVNASGSGTASAVKTVTTLLVAPTGLTATTAGSTEIDLTWTAVTDATSYKVERSTNQTTWTALTPSPALAGTDTAYNDTSALAGTQYYYRLSAIDAAGTSAASTAANATTYPAVPTLTATVFSATQVNLSWTASPSATSYKVETSTDSGTTWTTLSSPTTTSYSNTGLTADTSYQYRVSATNASGTSTPSAVKTVTTLLASPAGLAATTPSTTEIDLTWTAETDATSYKIERSLNNTTWSTLTPSPALSGTSTAYNDTALTAGTTYYYRLSGIDAAGTSAPATAVHLVTLPATTTLTATVFSATQVNLSWTAVTSATSYTVEQSTDSGTTWTTLASPTTTTYSNTGLTADTSYQYRVTAVNASGSGTASAVKTVSTLLVAPTGLTATTAGSTEIDLAWTTVTDATNYKIERSTDQTTWTAITPNPALSGTSTAYNDTSAVAGVLYYYRVSAIDAAGTSAASTSAHAQTYPATPTLTATVFSATQVNLAWTASSSATSYKVETSTDSGTTWTTLSSPTTTSYSNTGLTADTSYQYRVSAINAGGTSPASAVKTVTTLLASPAGLTATAPSTTEIDLTWTAETDATNYKIERSLNNTTWTTLTPSPALSGTSTAYNDTALTAGTTYFYRLSGIDAAGTSAPATAVHSVTLPATTTLTATVASATQVNLSWTAVVSASSYTVEQSTDSGTTWTTLASPTTTSYSNTGLTADTAYQYRVTAVNASGSGTASAVKSVTTLLVAPTGLTATTAGSTEIDLTWTAVTDATSYKIERSTNQTTWTALTPSPALGGTDTAYNDTSATAGTTFYYRISAIDAAGTSAASTSANSMTYPAVPTLTATVFSATQVNLSWTASTSATSYKVETSTDSGTTWTTLSSPTTTSYSNTGLTADTSYQYRVSATNAGGTSSPSAVKTVTTLLASPAGLAATVPSTTEVDLTWTAETDATSYKIERSLNNTTWTTLTPSPALSGTSTAYNDTALTAGTTYYYRISGIDAAGTSAAATAIHTVTLPATTTLTATVFSATQVNLSWTAVTSATSYTVEQSTDSGTTWTTLSSPTTTSYSNTGLTADTAYQYRVTAVNASGSGTASAVKSVTTLLVAPTGLTATTAGSTEVDLTWTAVTDATTYKIERSTNQTTWTALTPSPALAGTSTAYNDTSATAGTTFYYRISAIDAAGTSAASTSANSMTYPAVPTLTATVFSAAQVNLSWPASTSATSYKVETSTDSGTTWTTLASPTTTSYSNTGLTADTSYQYRVSATNAGGTSSPSAVKTVTTLLASPAGLAATTPSTTEVDLTWTAETDATSYKIERSLNNSTWTTLSPTPALSGTSTAYNDTALTAGTTYYYRLSGIDAAGTSAPATAVHLVTLPATTTLTATVASATQVNLSWTAVTSATSYTVEQSTDSGTTWTTLASPTTTSYSNTGLTADTSYQYRVTAVNASGSGSASAVKTVTTLLLAPTGLTSTTAGSTEIDLTWTAVTDATNYKIERSLDQTTWTTLTPSPALSGTSTAYNDTSALAGTTYYYRISAIDAAGTSAPATAVHSQTYPAVPTLTATVISATQVNLSWTSSVSATGYKLEQSSDSGTTWTTLVSSTATSYSNTSLTADTSYQYRVSATNAAGTSNTSAVKTVTTLLASPAGLAATTPSTTEIDLTWTAETDATSYKIERSTNNSTWTTLTPSPALSGTSTAYNDTALTAGTTYYYRISGIDAAGTSAPATAIHLVTLPATPTLTATVFSATQVNLSWTAATSATSYTVEQSSDSGTTWTTLASPTTTTYSNTGLTADTSYQYRVTAVNASGSGTSSAVKTVTTLLLAPTGLTATTASSTEIDLTWTAVTDATNYKIERSTNQTTWTTITPSPALSGTSTAYNDTSATAGTTFYYRISAIDAAGTSAASTLANAMTYPATPTLTATVVSATQVNLSWTASTSATSYKVEQSTDSGTTWTTIASPTTTSYSNTGLTADTGYQYRVSATNAGGTSVASAVKSVTTLLAAPSGVSSSSISATEIDLTWTAETDATNYKLERSTNNSTWTTITPSPALSGTSTSYADTSLTAGTTYYYRVSGISAAGTSAASTVVNSLTRLAAPTGLTATAASTSQINLTWTKDTATGLTGLTLQSSTDNTTWTSILTLDPTSTSASDIRLSSGTTYYYRLIATNAAGDSAPSTVAHATTN